MIVKNHVDFSNKRVHIAVMRRVLILTLMILFAANTTLASAWAKPCMDAMQDQSSFAEQQMAVDDKPPCPEHGSKQNDAQHCEGFCLCDHVAVSPTLHLSVGVGLHPAMAIALSFLLSDDALTSISQIPPKHPPKTAS